VQELLNKYIIPPNMVLAGDFRLLTMINYAIDLDNIKVYLVKNVSNDTFLWVIGKFLNDGKISMFPLLKEQSKELQQAIHNVLMKKV